MSYLLVFGTISLLITLHELGHFLAAKRMGIPIARFSVGFGRRLWGFKIGRTEYWLSLIPCGGYVMPASQDEEAFEKVPLLKRIVFSLGGNVRMIQSCSRGRSMPTIIDSSARLRNLREAVEGLILPLFCAANVFGASALLAQPGQGPNETNELRGGFAPPTTWTRQGVVLERQKSTENQGVSGDPCIVWDEAVQGWRMVLFYDPPGHAQAVCMNRDNIGPGQWKLEGPLPVANPQAVGAFHKPFIVMDPDRPNRAARIDGRYCLLVVSFKAGHKQVQRAWSERLAGPWTFEPEAIIPPGGETDFDAKHTDAVTGYYFPERKEFLYFYMGYPAKAQSRKISPYGSAQAVATQKPGEKMATKGSVILEPCQQAGHWASGWVGGLQLLRGAGHRWVAIVNASPTAPDPGKKAVWTEEPPPSLGGFAWCDEDWPVRGWHFAPEPIEWVKDIPQKALDAGEGYNLWRQFIHILPDGRAALFYNSGFYGREQLYLKVSDKPSWTARSLDPFK